MAGPISAPGVYVIERPSGSAPIAGVGTSTAGFIGNVPDTIQIPSSNPNFDPTSAIVDPGNLPYVTTDFTLLADAGDVKLIDPCSRKTPVVTYFSAGKNAVSSQLVNSRGRYLQVVSHLFDSHGWALICVVHKAFL